VIAMTDAQFYKSFSFNRFEHRQVHSTDWFQPSGCPKHYVARIINGTARICSAANTIQLQKDDIFYIPKGLKYHSYWYPDPEGSCAFYSFGFDCFPAAENTCYKLQLIPASAGAKAYLAELEQDITLSALSIGRLYRFIGEIAPCLLTEPLTGNEVIVNKALEYMRQNTRHTVKEVADYCGVSESSLFSKFRCHLNRTPIEMRREILAEKTAELLQNTDLTIEEITSLLDVSSSSYLRKIFCSCTGKTPSAFRKDSKQI